MQDEAEYQSFFLWLKEKTEHAWQRIDNEDLPSNMASGCIWRHGTRWSDGLSPFLINECESKWQIQFPNEYKLFLQLLHAPNLPMKCFAYNSIDKLVGLTRPGFYNWLLDTNEIASAISWPHQCVQFLIEEDGIWLPQWGRKPHSIESQQKKLADALRRNQKVSLIPIRYNFYLVGGENDGKGMILSIPPAQPEVALYASDLRKFLLFEFAELLQLASPVSCNLEDYYRARRIPFWGDLLT